MCVDPGPEPNGSEAGAIDHGDQGCKAEPKSFSGVLDGDNDLDWHRYHGVFSGPAYERLAYENSRIEKIVVTDTIPLRPGHPENIIQLSTAQTLADSIRRIFTDDSVSEIFAGENQLF